MDAPKVAKPEQFRIYGIADLRRMRRAKWADGNYPYGAGVAEMDFAPAPAITAALAEAARGGNLGYPYPQALEVASVALCEWLRDNYNWAVDPDNILAVGGLVRALEACLLFFTPPDSAVVVPTPAYPPFLSLPRQLGLEVKESPMSYEDGRWSFDLNNIDQAFAQGARLLILCNPHNPTGTVFPREELAALADIVASYDGRVFADEIHAPLVYPETTHAGTGRRHVPYATVSPAAASHALTGVSVTKGWNVGGIACAHLIVAEQDRITASRLSTLLAHSASTPGLFATAAAYQEGKPWLHEALNYLDRNRRQLTGLIQEHLPGVRYRVPSATYLAWLDFRETAWADRPAVRAKEIAGVVASEGTDYGSVGNGFLRLNFATPYPVLEELVQAMGSALSKELPQGCLE